MISGKKTSAKFTRDVCDLYRYEGEGGKTTLVPDYIDDKTEIAQDWEERLNQAISGKRSEPVRSSLRYDDSSLIGLVRCSSIMSMPPHILSQNRIDA